eukprot:6484620-Karenia_brevis.AAC.1
MAAIPALRKDNGECRKKHAETPTGDPTQICVSSENRVCFEEIACCLSKRIWRMAITLLCQREG